VDNGHRGIEHVRQGLGRPDDNDPVNGGTPAESVDGPPYQWPPADHKKGLVGKAIREARFRSAAGQHNRGGH
jgi:hypothetical protein